MAIDGSELWCMSGHLMCLSRLLITTLLCFCRDVQHSHGSCGRCAGLWCLFFFNVEKKNHSFRAGVLYTHTRPLCSSSPLFLSSLRRSWSLPHIRVAGGEGPLFQTKQLLTTSRIFYIHCLIKFFFFFFLVRMEIYYQILMSLFVSLVYALFG